MFGSTYILNSHARLLWGLNHGLRLAMEGPSPLAELASQLTQAPIGSALERLFDLPFHTMWVAVLANQARYGGPRPYAALATGLIAVARDVGIDLPEDAFEIARSSEGLYLAPGQGRNIVSIDRGGVVRTISLAGCNGLLLLGDNPLLRHLIGDGPGEVSKCPEGWDLQLADGLALLAMVSPEQHRRFLRYVSVVASFEAERGLLQSMSIGEWPGCVVARCGNPPAHVCDQLVHEASHQLLDAEFAKRPELVDQLERAPAGYSPFFQQPRPCLKLVHGLVSYLEVLRFWRALLVDGRWDTELSPTAARGRVEDVRALCIEGIRSLRATVSADSWDELRTFLVEVAPEFALVERDVQKPAIRTFASAQVRDAVAQMKLPPISHSEIVLALEGAKVSRVSLSLDEGAQLARALSPEFVPLFSRAVMVTRHEHLKGNFSNLTSGTFEYYRPPPDAFVYAYVSNSPDALRHALRADEEDAAGSYLDIPPCCCNFFNHNWEQARANHQGDLASLLLASESPDSMPELHPWQTNPFAMYFGQGMTWHFPCSWKCAATIAVIDNRAAVLDRLLPEVARNFRQWHMRPIVWSPSHGVLVADLHSGLDRIMLHNSIALEASQGLARVKESGVLEWRHGAWRSPNGQTLADLLEPQARVLLWR